MELGWSRDGLKMGRDERGMESGSSRNVGKMISGWNRVCFGMELRWCHVGVTMESGCSRVRVERKMACNADEIGMGSRWNGDEVRRDAFGMQSDVVRMESVWIPHGVGMESGRSWDGGDVLRME